MASAHFCFHGDLNYFLARRRQNVALMHDFDWRASIKDMIESLGVPHCEIELIVVNGKSVDFNYLVQADDRIEVYSHYDAAEMAGKVRLRPPLEGKLRFVLDTHLGRLAAYLRMMGFDTLYRNDYADDTLARISHDEERVLLTRDIGLLKRSLVTYGYYVRETAPPIQLITVAQRYKLVDFIEPFKHCIKCNGLVAPVAKEAIVERLPYRTATYYDDFHCCQECEQIYWKGSHYEEMQALMAQLRNGA